MSDLTRALASNMKGCEGIGRVEMVVRGLTRVRRFYASTDPVAMRSEIVDYVESAGDGFVMVDADRYTFEPTPALLAKVPGLADFAASLVKVEPAQLRARMIVTERERLRNLESGYTHPRQREDGDDADDDGDDADDDGNRFLLLQLELEAEIRARLALGTTDPVAITHEFWDAPDKLQLSIVSMMVEAITEPRPEP